MKKTILMVLLLAAVRPAMAAEAPLIADTGSARVFTPGEVVVTGKKDTPANTVSSSRIEELDKTDIARAVNLLPGVNFGNVGARNEGMIYVRGFDMRQVPLYLDGVPQYVPYDGYVDPNRFTTFELSQITVSKGYSSVLYGPNTLGGAINLVTRKPEKEFEGSLRSGITFGDEQLASEYGALNIGSNHGTWYVQGSISDLNRKFWPLSGKFTPKRYENGGKRDNSQTDDLTGGLKIGFTPNSTDEYVLSFNGISSSKGVPVYTGSNPSSAIRYWKYTDWDKSSIYYIGKTMLGSKTYLKTKAYFDGYYNALDSYDDATYTTQKKKSSFTSIYDDKTFGASAELGTEIAKDDILKLALHEKHDMHREYNVGQTAKHFEDNTFSIAAENTWTASYDVNVIVGVRQDFRKTIRAQDLQGTSLSSFPLDDNSATNYQIAVVGHPGVNQELTGYVARTTRFPTLKDRYSYRMGSALPNPSLAPEQSWNYGIDYSFKPAEKLKLTASVYLSKLSDVIQQVDNVAYVNSIWVYQYQNTGKATYKGFDLSSEWTPASWIKVFGGYSYIDRKNDSNPSLYFTDVPKQKFNGAVQFLHDKQTWTLVEGEYDSKRYSTSNGNYSAGGHGLINLRGSLGLNSALSLQAAVENLFDRNYQVAEGYPEPGRTYVISMAYAF
ncbi:MAG: TonB-dependent receptor [Chlorobiaceae bacterium]|nr:TonB-dependent receptor [Chlorobiaceae bacterium]